MATDERTLLTAALTGHRRLRLCAQRRERVMWPPFSFLFCGLITAVSTGHGERNDWREDTGGMSLSFLSAALSSLSRVNSLSVMSGRFLMGSG